MKLHNENTCFNAQNEEYIGTWFGYDVYSYSDPIVKKGLLAAYGSEPGDYVTWIGDESWFEPNAKIGYPDGSRAMEEHLTTNPSSKAFLMAFAAIANRNM